MQISVPKAYVAMSDTGWGKISDIDAAAKTKRNIKAFVLLGLVFIFITFFGEYQNQHAECEHGNTNKLRRGEYVDQGLPSVISP